MRRDMKNGARAIMFGPVAMFQLRGFLLALMPLAIFGRELNVCKEFYQYEKRAEGCYHNPDEYLEVTKMVKRYGFPVESYDVATDDGYILQVYRIPNPSKPPVFLQHGIMLSCLGFTTTGNHSLAFLLHAAGYDVWLGNFRGSRYSSKHKTLSSDDIAFWDFSYHEMGKYDLKTQIDLVHSIVDRQIYYIGYSMGTTASYIYNILHPEDKKVKLFISLSPIAYMSNLPSFIYPVASFWPLIEPFVMKLSNGVLFERTPSMVRNIKNMCTNNGQQLITCMLLLNMFFGFDVHQFDPETLPIVLLQDIEAVSTKTLTHYFQAMHRGDFAQFDHGLVGNVRIYGKSSPPRYDFAKMTIPVYLVHAKNDFVSTVENVEKLFEELGPSLTPYGKYIIPYRFFNHADFISAKDRKTFVYDHIITFLKSIT